MGRSEEFGAGTGHNRAVIHTERDVELAAPHLDAEQRGWVYETIVRGSHGGVPADNAEFLSTIRSARTLPVAPAPTYDWFGKPADSPTPRSSPREHVGYNLLSDPESAYNKPDKGPKQGVPRGVFPEGGVPLRGPLTPKQEAWMRKGRGRR